MKKKVHILLLITFTFTLKIYSQELYSIVPMQAGTINITSGKAVINLSNEVQEILKNVSLSPSYYIVFTPVDNTVFPSISNKTISSFTAITKTNNKQADNLVDYIVFVKRKIIQLNAKKLNRQVPNN